MESGRWSLLYTTYDSLAGHCDPEFPDVEVKLSADNQDRAFSEAKTKWQEVLDKGTFVVKKRAYRPDPESKKTREYYDDIVCPYNPRLRFELDVTRDFPDSQKTLI